MDATPDGSAAHSSSVQEASVGAIDWLQATVELIGIAGDDTVKGKKGQELRTANAAGDLIAAMPAPATMRSGPAS